MKFSEEDVRESCTDQRHDHIPMGIPRIALRRDDGFLGQHGRRKLKQFIEGGKAHNQANCDPYQHGTSFDDPIPKQILLDQKEGNESLCDMGKAVKIVAVELKGVPQAVKKRIVLIGVLCADQKDDDLKENQIVDKGREFKFAMDGDNDDDIEQG